MLKIQDGRKRACSKRQQRRIRLILFLLVSICLISCYFIPRLRKEKNVIYLEKLNRGIYKIDELQSKQNQYEKELNIIVVDFKWNQEFEGGNNPKYLVFHHTASKNLTVEAINDMHVENGWGGIGYHYYIRKNGDIYKGRPEEAVGAHAIGKNRESIGICLEGNFENEKPTEKQINSTIKLSADMIIKYNMESTLGHKDTYNTLCPGKNFLIDDINYKIADELEAISKNK